MTEQTKEFWSGQNALPKEGLIEVIGRWHFKGYGPELLRAADNKIAVLKIYDVDDVEIRYYNIPDDSENLISDLMEMSLHWSITYIGQTSFGAHYVGLKESRTGETNIDAEVLERIWRKLGVDE